MRCGKTDDKKPPREFSARRLLFRKRNRLLAGCRRAGCAARWFFLLMLAGMFLAFGSGRRARHAAARRRGRIAAGRG